MDPKDVAVFALSENTDNDMSEPFVTRNRKASPLGDHDSGMCEVSLSAFVRRSAAPVPSAACQKRPRSPSRSDWNATRCPSADQIGKRFLPPKVRRRIAVAPDKS